MSVERSKTNIEGEKSERKNHETNDERIIERETANP